MRGAPYIEVRTLKENFVLTLASSSAVYKAQEVPPNSSTLSTLD